MSKKTRVWAWAALLTVSHLPIAEAADVSFLAREDFAVGGAPHALLLGDLNGDGWGTR